MAKDLEMAEPRQPDSSFPSRSLTLRPRAHNQPLRSAGLCLRCLRLEPRRAQKEGRRDCRTHSDAHGDFGCLRTSWPVLGSMLGFTALDSLKLAPFEATPSPRGSSGSYSKASLRGIKLSFPFPLPRLEDLGLREALMWYGCIGAVLGFEGVQAYRMDP